MSITMNSIEKKRYTPIQRNYKRLQDHYSEVNALKYVEYLAKKTHEELLKDFDCVITVPNLAVWDLVDEMIKGFMGDYGSLRKMLYAIDAYAADMEQQFVGKTMEETHKTYFTNIFTRVEGARKILSQMVGELETANLPIHVVDQVTSENGILREQLVEYTDTLMKILTEDYDELTLVNMLDDLQTREKYIQEAIAPHREVVLNSPLDAPVPRSLAEAAGRLLIRQAPMSELTEALQGEKDFSSEQSIRELYAEIIHNRDYSQESYDRMEDFLYQLEERYSHNRLVLPHIEKMRSIVQEAQTEAMDSLIPISLFEKNGDYLVYEDIKEIAVDEEEDLPSINLDRLDELIGEIDESELPDMEIHEERMTFESFLEDWCAGNCSNETLYGMLYTAETIQMILEASGRKKEAKKLKLSKAKRDKEAKKVHQLKIRGKKAKSLKKKTRKTTFAGSAGYENFYFSTDEFVVWEDSSGREDVRAKIARKKEEISRNAVNAVKKAGRKGEHAAVASKRAAEHVDNLVSSSIQKILDSPYKQKREEILKGGFRVKLNGLIKKAIFHGALFAINPILGAIGLMGAAARDHAVDIRVRRQILGDLREELKMVDEKIEDAKSDGNKKEKYQLMRMRSKIESEIARIERNQEATDHSSNKRNEE